MRDLGHDAARRRHAVELREGVVGAARLPEQLRLVADRRRLPDAELRHLAHEVAHALAAVGPVRARLVGRPVPAAVEVVPQRRRPHLRQPDDERQRPARGPLRRPPPLPRARPDQENDQADDAPQGRDHRRKGLKTYIILRAAAPTITEVKVSF